MLRRSITWAGTADQVVAQHYCHFAAEGGNIIAFPFPG